MVRMYYGMMRSPDPLLSPLNLSIMGLSDARFYDDMQGASRVLRWILDFGGRNGWKRVAVALQCAAQWDPRHYPWITVSLALALWAGGSHWALRGPHSVADL